MLIPSLFLVGFFFAQLGVLVGVRAEQFDDVSFAQTFVLQPLIFLGGVFYSASLLDEPFQTLTHFNPIYYMINLVRYGFLGYTEANVALSLAILTLATSALFAANLRLFTTGYKLRVLMIDFLVKRDDIRETPDRRIRAAGARARPGAPAGPQLRADLEQRDLRGDGRPHVLLGLLPCRGGLGTRADVGLRRRGAERGGRPRCRCACVRLPAPVLPPRRDARRGGRERLHGPLAAPGCAALHLPARTRSPAATPSTGRTRRSSRCSFARCSSPRS